MARILLVVCHPVRRSFSHAVAASAEGALHALGHEVIPHDLYDEGFDPVLGEAELKRKLSFDPLVARYVKELEQSEGLILVHPEWWSQPPAMLKGWLDRVVRQGIGYEFSGEEFLRKSHVPLLSGKRALVLASSDRERPAAPPLLCSLWRESFGYCGLTDLRCEILFGMHDLDAAERREWLEGVTVLCEEVFGRSEPSGTAIPP
ncbi:MAG TPA: NAD(P)H-dependent oxidoreductase [Spirochaetia bacterium]|nr:NAD(P)H-dependent oxidoreductase [Spirochaetia bacterium]